MSQLEQNVLHQRSGPDVAWSRVNTAEAVVGVQTPLSWSFWDEGGELGFRRAYCELGFLPGSARAIPEDVEDKFTAIFYGRAATNVSAFRAALDAMPFAATDDAEQSFFSTRDGAARARSPRRRRVAAALRMPLAALRLPARLARLRADAERFWRDSLRALPADDVAAAAARIERAVDRFGDEVAAQIVASTLATFCSGRLQRLLDRHPELATASDSGGGGEAPDEPAAAGDPLALRLLGGFGDLEEIRVSFELWQAARGDGDLAPFLARHGFRGPADGELSSRSWREDPKPVEALLGPYRALPDSKSPEAAQRRRVADREAAARELLERLHGGERWRARLWLALAARFVPLRVVAKAAFQQTFDVARAAARQIGVALASDGVLERPEDVFYLQRDELARPPADVRARVAERRALRDAYQRLDLPLEFNGMPEPFPLDRDDRSDASDATGASHTTDATDASSTRPVSGLGVSAGVVEGRARVVLDPSAGELEPGEILVCNTTDPSWSSYFLIAAGVVIDVGGPLSHGAIVARELGIPCVINTVDGTRRLRSGDTLRIDGGTGRVEVLS